MWYRARNPLPATVVIVALTAVAGLVWVGVLNQPDPTAGGCVAAAAGATGSSVSPVPMRYGQRLPADGLDPVAPAPPQHAVVRVLNANGERGEAGIVASGLASLGFVPSAEPTNDPLYPGFDLRCHGEIRFGPTGQAAARTLSLAVPCAELVRDTRPDAVIDLALGTEFVDLRPNDAAREALQSLVRLGEPMLPTPGGQAAGAAVPAVDSDTLHDARQVSC
ncbi:MAG: envelope integrity protein Cei [Pseudonocardiaceae bacterium]